MIFSTFAVTYPLARLLDKMLGKQHSQFFQRKELEQLVLMHSEQKIKELEEEKSLKESSLKE
jgi:hypothetical protein